MFGSFHGLPVHALVLHVAVVLAPLSAVLGLAFLVPKWRRILGWPLVAVAAVSVVTLFVAKESGQDLRAALGTQLTSPGNLSGALVAQHQMYANRLVLAGAVLFVLSLVAVLLRRRTDVAAVGWAAGAVVAVGAIAVMVLTYQTGEAGAKAVWNPAGTFDYSSK